jgi:hypothetical protein
MRAEMPFFQPGARPEKNGRGVDRARKRTKGGGFENTPLACRAFDPAISNYDASATHHMNQQVNALKVIR